MTPERLALKRATDAMLSAIGGQTKAAPHTRVGQSTLSSYASRHHHDAFVPIDVVADLEPLAWEREGWPHVTQALCQAMGGVFVALPEVPAEDGDVLILMGRVSKEAGDVAHAICDAMADGRVCAVDQSAIQREVRQLIEKAVALGALVDSLPVSKGKSA